VGKVYDPGISTVEGKSPTLIEIIGPWLQGKCIFGLRSAAAASRQQERRGRKDIKVFHLNTKDTLFFRFLQHEKEPAWRQALYRSS
jgi:hypothetical protein